MWRLNTILVDLLVLLGTQHDHGVRGEAGEDCLNCSNTSQCEPGYYGFSCQYVDLAFNAIVNHEVLFDGDDQTCLTLNMTMTTMSLDRFYPMTTFRIKSPDTDKVKQVHIEFLSADRQHRVICKNTRILMRYLDEYEIDCDINVAVQVIYILWLAPIYVCSVYVSGGRKLVSNVHPFTEEVFSHATPGFNKSTTTPARHKSTPTSITADADTTQPWFDTETTSQGGNLLDTTTFPETQFQNVTSVTQPTARPEVNESLNVNQPIEKQLQKREYITKCDPLDPDTSSYLNLTFNTIYTIFRFKIQGIGQKKGSAKFVLLAYDEYEIKVFSYRYEVKSFKFEVNINWPDHGYRTIQRIVIASESTPEDSVQTICGVELYGDCPFGRYGLNCHKDCSRSCQFDKCDTENGYCWLCSEYEQHARCVSQETKLCGRHRYGGNCDNECRSCFGGLCNRSTGLCLTGCKSVDACHEEKAKCPLFKYGPNCRSVCNYCYMGLCDMVTGQCMQGCSLGYFGGYCNQTCSDNCIYRKCEEETRACILGCVDDWTGPMCEERCSSNCAGEGRCFQGNRSCTEGCLEGYLDSSCTVQSHSKVVYALLIFCTLFSLVIAIICIDEPKPQEQTKDEVKVTPGENV